MKKQVKYGVLIGLLVLTSISSFILGQQIQQAERIPRTSKQTSSSTESSSLAKTDELAVNKVAVVNLDEGVAVEGRILNYASQLSRYPSDNFVSTSLEEAKRGLLTGDYGGYVVIPATFSGNIESLNTGVQKSQIIYSVSNQLTAEKKLEVKDDIHAYTKGLNQSISYLYVDSILNEFQETQDSISAVLTNNDKGNEALAIVEPADLLNFMTIPELKQPDVFAEAINIEQEIGSNSELLAVLIGDYQAGLAIGQEVAAQIIADGSSLSENLAVIFNEIGTRRIGYSETGDFLYKDELTVTADELKAYLEKAQQWATDISSDVTAEIRPIEAALLSANHYYREGDDGQSLYQGQVKQLAEYYHRLEIMADLESILPIVPKALLTEDEIRFTDQEDQVVASIRLEEITNEEDEVIQMINPSDLIEFVNEQLSETINFTDPRFTAKDHEDEEFNWNELGSHQMVITKYFPSFGPFQYEKEEGGEAFVHDQKITSEERLTESVASVTKLAGISITGEGNPLSEEASKKEVEKVKDNLQLNVVDKLEEETILLNEQLNQTTLDFTALTSEFSQTIGSFDPYSLLDQSALQGQFGGIQENNQLILGKSSEQISKMGETLFETFSLYGENQLAILDAAQTANEKGAEQVTGGLSTAKESLDELMADNYTLLQPITTKLAYTRTGGIGDRSVYQYIVSPLTISNQSEANRVTPAERRTEENDQPLAAQTLIEKKKSKKTLIIPLTGGFLLLVLLTLGIYLAIKSKRNTQKW